MLLTYCIEN